MIDWWNSLDLMMKILWGITIAVSLIFIIQTIMTFIGASDAGDFDLDTGTDGLDGHMDSAGDVTAAGDATDAAEGAHLGSGMPLLTFRNMVNFFLGFGWTSVLLHEKIGSTSLLMIVSIIVGIALVFLVMYIFKWLASMQQSGNINVYKAAVDCQGKVYLTIPGERAGTGKVQITINNSVREYSALTDGPELKTGTDIKVVDVVSSDTLLVEELNSVII
jgi:uncharacterized membrane protein